MENPWNIQSIYQLQYFNCPSCVFKDNSKQEFVNHAYENHPDSIEHLKNIYDNSLMDIELPWTELEMKIKTEDYSDSYEFQPLEFLEMNEDPLSHSKDDIKIKIENKSLECEKCGKMFDALKKLKNHIKNIHNEKKEFKCEECGKIFSRRDYLRDHVKTVHEGIKQKCGMCEKEYGRLSHLRDHIRTVHEGQKVLHDCEECDKKFSSKVNLKSHIANVHEGHKEPEINTFSQMSDFKTDIKSDHEGVKHNCDIHM